MAGMGPLTEAPSIRRRAFVVGQTPSRDYSIWDNATSQLNFRDSFVCHARAKILIKLINSLYKVAELQHTIVDNTAIFRCVFWY